MKEKMQFKNMEYFAQVNMSNLVPVICYLYERVFSAKSNDFNLNALCLNNKKKIIKKSFLAESYHSYNLE